MSKRGKALKLAKSGYADILHAMVLAYELPKEDQKWFLEKMEKYQDMMSTKMYDVSHGITK